MTVLGNAVLAAAFALAWAVGMILVFDNIGWTDWFVWIAAAAAAITLTLLSRRTA